VEVPDADALFLRVARGEKTAVVRERQGLKLLVVVSAPVEQTLFPAVQEKSRSWRMEEEIARCRPSGVNLTPCTLCRRVNRAGVFSSG
jgi:hypothetical protein